MGVLLNSAVDFFEAKKVKIVRVYSGTFMTSTDMSGFSLSLLQLKEEWKEFLDAPVRVCSVTALKLQLLYVWKASYKYIGWLQTSEFDATLGTCEIVVSNNQMKPKGTTSSSLTQ